MKWCISFSALRTWMVVQGKMESGENEGPPGVLRVKTFSIS